jgi:hypothetical protein
MYIGFLSWFSFLSSIPKSLLYSILTYFRNRELALVLGWEAMGSSLEDWERKSKK